MHYTRKNYALKSEITVTYYQCQLLSSSLIRESSPKGCKYHGYDRPNCLKSSNLLRSESNWKHEQRKERNNATGREPKEEVKQLYFFQRKRLESVRFLLHKIESYSTIADSKEVTSIHLSVLSLSILSEWVKSKVRSISSSCSFHAYCLLRFLYPLLSTISSSL